jgi:HEAT repeat protein
VSGCRIAALALSIGAAPWWGASPARAQSARPAAPPTATAPPVASTHHDLDRDGARDEMRIERSGSLTVVSGRTGKVVAWKPILTGGAAERGEVQIATGSAVGGRVVIVAVAFRRGGAATDLGGRGEALAAEWRAGQLHELWRGPVGPQGADGESTLYMEAGRHGLLRYAGRAGVARCDGKTAHLHAERFDFARGRFRSVDEAPRIPGDAPVLTATRTPPPGVAAAVKPLDFRALAASSQLGAGPGDLVAPAEIEDGDPATAWIEGRAGFGRGEFVTARASLDGGLVRAIRIIPGHASSGRSFAEQNRLRSIGLLVGRDRAYRATFPTDPARSGKPADPYWIALPEPVAADCVSLVVLEVFPGRGAGGAGRTAISELAVLTAMDLAPGGAAAALAQQVAAGGHTGEQAARVLARLGPGAEAALVAQARRAEADAGAVLRLRRVLADLPAGPAELVRGLTAPRLHPADAERFARALRAIGAPSVTPLLEAVTDDSTPASGRARAAQVLGGIADRAALVALLGAAGRGPREVRRAVAHAVGARPAGELQAVVEAARAGQADEGREADLWRAVGLVARTARRGDPRAAASAAIGERLASATGYELRYRLIEAAGATADPALLGVIAAELRGRSASVAAEGPHRGSSGRSRFRLSDGRSRERSSGATPPGSLAAAQAAALRRVAAAALGQSDAPAASAALAAAARDPDPGVREAAAETLGEGARAAGDAALIAQIGGDSWARVRRAAAIGLGGACRRPAPASALRRAALRDADVQVRRASLSSLMVCGAPGAVRFLLAIAADRGAPGELRTHAVRLVGGSGDQSAARPMAELAAAELERAFSDKAAITTAASAVHALGELGDPVAIPVLLRAADTVAFPEIQGAAATALGKTCAPGALPVLRDLARSGQHQVSAPARAALRKCARRGP